MAADKMNAFPDAAEIKRRVSFHNFFFFHISSYTCFIWVLIKFFKENSNLFVFKILNNVEIVGTNQTLMHRSHWKDLRICWK